MSQQWVVRSAVTRLSARNTGKPMRSLSDFRHCVLVFPRRTKTSVPSRDRWEHGTESFRSWKQATAFAQKHKLQRHELVSAEDTNLSLIETNGRFRPAEKEWLAAKLFQHKLRKCYDVNH